MKKHLNLDSLICTLLLIISFCSLLQGQTSAPNNAALVTFYSRSRNVGFPFHRLQGFKGALFRDGKQIASFSPGHFITFEMQPGLYDFGATPWPSKDSKKGTHLPLTLRAGEHAYVEAVLSTPAALSVQVILKEVTCEGAQQDNLGNGRLDEKNLTQGKALPYVSEGQLPACPVQNP